MYYDAATKEIAPAPQELHGPYPIEVRKRYVELFLASQPISRRKFAEKYGINRKSIMKWLRVYEGMPINASKSHPRKPVPAAGREQATRPARTAARNPPPKASPAADGEQAPGGAPGDGGIRTITIPYREYTELLMMKTKLDEIRAVCQ